MDPSEHRVEHILRVHQLVPYTLRGHCYRYLIECTGNLPHSLSPPLHRASRNARLEARQFLLNHGADIDARNVFNRTALGYAAIEGHVEFARMLLERGPVIDARDIGDEIPLHFAAEYGETQVAQLLLEHGVDVNARNKLGLTPSQLGSRERDQEIVELLSVYVAKSVNQ